jgi:hypothetical protein
MALIAWGMGPRSLFVDARSGGAVHRITGHYRTKWHGIRHPGVARAFSPAGSPDFHSRH